MKKAIRVIALVATFILSSFGMSEASSYNLVSMSNLTPQEFIQQMKDLSQQDEFGPLTFSELNYGGPDADDAYTIYVAHMGKYTTVKFRCDKRGMVSSVILKRTETSDTTEEQKDVAVRELVSAEKCILKIIGLTDEEADDFYQYPDVHTSDVTANYYTDVKEKMYPRISKRVIECSDTDIEYGASIVYTRSYMIFVSME